MTSEEKIENALRHLGEEVPYTNLAGAALRQSRRIRARRTVLGGAGAVLAMTAMSLPFVYLQHDSRTPAAPPFVPQAAPSRSSAPTPTASAAPPSRPAPPGSVALPGNRFVASSTSDSGSRIYDPRRHGYRPVTYPQAWAAPVGGLVIVADKNERLGVLDPATDRVRWIPDSKLVVGRPQWSSDGAHVVFSGPGRTSDTISIVVADVATARARTLQPAVPCTELCQPSWLPGDAEVGLPPEAQPRSGLQAYAASDGRQTRFVTLPGAVQSTEAWSPDGRFVVGEINDQGYAAIGVIEVATGTVTAKLAENPRESIVGRSVLWAGKDRLVALLDRAIIVFSPAGKELSRVTLPSTLQGEQNQLSLARS